MRTIGCLMKEMSSQGYSEVFADVYEKFFSDFSIKAAPQIYNFYVRQKSISPLSRFALLDLCCGGGNVASFFLQKNAEVVGIDLSEKMLQIAKAKNKAHEKQCQWILSDSSCFTVNRRFDIVVSTCNSLNLLGTIEKLSECFDRVYHHLSDNGVFIFDLKTALGAEVQSHTFIKDGEEYTLITQGYFDKPIAKAYLHFWGYVKDKHSSYQKFEQYQTEGIYNLQEVKNHLLQKGFDDVRYFTYGSKELCSVVDQDILCNIVIIATK